MRVDLKTHWDKEDLMKLIKECFKRSGVSMRNYTIKLRERSKRSKGWGQQGWLAQQYTKWLAQYYKGWAWFEEFRISLIVPSPSFYSIVEGSDGKRRKVYEPNPVGFDSVTFAKVLTHEIQHTLGLHHRDMIPWQEIEADWAKEFVVESREGK